MVQKVQETQSLEQMLCFAVYSTAHAFNRAYRPLLEALDLTYPQYLVMNALWEGDGQNVKGLAHRLLLDSGTMTPLLKRLEAAGLVQRKRDGADERQVIVYLTNAGRDLQQRASEVPETIRCATGLSSKELQTTIDQVLRLRGSLSEFAENGGEVAPNDNAAPSAARQATKA